MIFDSHSHYDDERFSEDREELLLSLKEKNVDKVIDVCADINDMDKIIALTERYPFVYGALGVHPDNVDVLTAEKLDLLKKKALSEKIVAIGEIGLDYYGESTEKSLQKKWFEEQLDIANELNMPVIIHSRDAAEDTMGIINNRSSLNAVMHCYSYSKELAAKLVDRGLYIGIGGVVTFKNGKKLKEVAEYIPLESILLETDCPYLAPEPFRGTRNDSSLIKYVVDEIAALKGIDSKEVEAVCYSNACRFFGI